MVALWLTSPLSPTIAVTHKDLVSRRDICSGIIGRLADLCGSCPCPRHGLKEARGSRWIVSSGIQARFACRDVDSCLSIGTKHLSAHTHDASVSCTAVHFHPAHEG